MDWLRVLIEKKSRLNEGNIKEHINRSDKYWIKRDQREKSFRKINVHPTPREKLKKIAEK